MALYAFDGTWNESVVDDDTRDVHDTNVVCFHHYYQDEKWYVAGPGTRLGKLGKVLGGISGAGARDRLQKAYRQLVANYRDGDTTIDVVGFSRGAAISLDFVNLVNKKGIWDPDKKKVIAKQVPVRFVGLWDVVGSFGIPLGQRVFQRLNIGHELKIPGNVEHAYHALALDERRQTFVPTRQLNAYEVWFRGSHSDVGGGNGRSGLQEIALRWMLYKAKAAGLPVADEGIAWCDGRIDLDAALYEAQDPVKNARRAIWHDDRVHYTVSARDGHNNPPTSCPPEGEADERIAVPCARLPKRQPPR